MNSSIATRRRLVRQLIVAQPITSQHELVEMLEEAGHYVTQATVSRDLDAIGAVKMRTERGSLRYELPDEAPTPVGDNRETVRIIDEFVYSMAAAGNLLVVRTRPGAANVVGGAIDRADLAGVLGTVAGDDTVLIVTAEDTGGLGLLGELERIGVSR